MSGEAHLGETLGDLLDGRLAPEERARAEAHLSACDQCRRELAAMDWVKGMARAAAAAAEPAGLSAAISRALDGAERHGTAAPRPAWRRWVPAVAAAVLALVATALLLGRRPERADLPGAVAQDLSAFSEGRLPLEMRTADTGQLERFFSARGIRFDTRVFDLAMMGFQVEGGRVHVLGGRKSALFVYRGADGQVLLCEMFEGRLAELPQPAEIRDHNGIRFAIHRRDGLTMVFWEEGPVMCVLVSRMDPEAVIQLAFAKAMKV